MRTSRLATSILILSLLLVVACDELADTPLRNESEAAFVYDGALDITVEPGEEITLSEFPGYDLEFRLLTLDGAVLFDGVVPWAYLEAMDFRLVVTDDGLQVPSSQ